LNPLRRERRATS